MLSGTECTNFTCKIIYHIIFSDFKVELEACDILQTWMKCREALLLEQEFQKLVKQCVFSVPYTNTPPLFVAENEMLALSTYPNSTEGIFYVMPLVIEVGGENHLYIR